MRQLTHSSTISSLPFVLLAVQACPPTNTAEQMIMCETDPDSGVVLRCEPGTGDGGEDRCTDVDEDGDGWPTDETPGGGGTTVGFTGEGSGSGGHGDYDSDHDGVPDEEDCDEHPGEVDLPYDIRPMLGQTLKPIRAAFDEKGAQPAALVSVTMEDGGTWRFTELSNDTEFTVTQADCDHEGNRDVGRDRVFVTWRNVDGSTETDHLDIRYCDD